MLTSLENLLEKLDKALRVIESESLPLTVFLENFDSFYDGRCLMSSIEDLKSVCSTYSISFSKPVTSDFSLDAYLDRLSVFNTASDLESHLVKQSNTKAVNLFKDVLYSIKELDLFEFKDDQLLDLQEDIFYYGMKILLSVNNDVSDELKTEYHLMNANFSPENKVNSIKLAEQNYLNLDNPPSYLTWELVTGLHFVGTNDVSIVEKEDIFKRAYGYSKDLPQSPALDGLKVLTLYYLIDSLTTSGHQYIDELRLFTGIEDTASKNYLLSSYFTIILNSNESVKRDLLNEVKPICQTLDEDSRDIESLSSLSKYYQLLSEVESDVNLRKDYSNKSKLLLMRMAEVGLK